MASEKCPKCSAKMAIDLNGYAYCTYGCDPKTADQHRIAELESLLRASEARERELQGKLEEAKRRSEYWKAEHLAANAVIDSTQSQLRTTEATLVAVREALREAYGWFLRPMHADSCSATAPGIDCDCGLVAFEGIARRAEALSATASQRVEAIRMEAEEKLAEADLALIELCACTDWSGYESSPTVDAAIEGARYRVAQRSTEREAFRKKGADQRDR